MTVPAGARPRLAGGVRLREDSVRGEIVLLAPERVLKVSRTAAEILRRCDGERQLGEIIDELASLYTAEADRIGADVRALLSDLASKRLVEL